MYLLDFQAVSAVAKAVRAPAGVHRFLDSSNEMT